MSESHNCPRCDAPLPADAPEGACPKCLLAAGFESADGVETAAAPDLASVAAQFPELEILSELGRGGMGVVYKARQKNLERFVALKVLPREIVEGDGGRVRFEERFTREARALARLSHPNIVGVHEFGEREGVYYFLMEFVDGVNLRQAMRKGNLTPVEALAIVPQICDALQYAHDQGVVHRDIKPENVLVDTSGHVKIADFGLAKLVTTTPDQRTLTKQGLVMGTPHYMAPEQFEKPTEVDHRADIYSLGVVLYEMLTGELPIGRFAPPSEMVRVDVRLDEVVLRSLEKDADRRYQAVADVRTGIDALGDPAESAHGHRGGYARRHGPTGESKLSRLALWAVLLPVIAVVLGLGVPLVVGLFQPDGDPTTWKVGFAGLGVLGISAVVGGIVLSIVALVQIRASHGKLHGTGLAIAGLLLPLLCCMPGVGLAYLGMVGGAYDEMAPSPVPDEESRLIAPADRLEHAGDVQIDVSVPAGTRGSLMILDQSQRRNLRKGGVDVDVTTTASWPLPKDHVFVVTRVTMTGDIGAKRPVVHLGEVEVLGADEDGTDPTWKGSVSFAPEELPQIHVKVVGDSATSVVIEGRVIRPADTSIHVDRTTLLVDDRTVTLNVPEGVERMDLTGRFDGDADDNEGNALIIPADHFFLVEQVVLSEAPRYGRASIHVGATVLWAEPTRADGNGVWAGRMEIHPGGESALWVRSHEGAPVEVEVTGRMYRIVEQK
jgi:tRNA A-37 threonylcarbamoyl transferase component Bud32